MPLYSISETARLCGINPVTLRAWQRRYGLLKPRRSEGGHRLFDEDDLQTIRTIIEWVNRGVPVGQVKALLSEDQPVTNNSFAQQTQQMILAALQTQNSAKVRQIIAQTGRDYPAELLVNDILRPLRNTLKNSGDPLLPLLGQLDGIIIEHAVLCLNSARVQVTEKYILLGWGAIDHTELWLTSIVLSKPGVAIDILAQPLTLPRLELFTQQHIFLWAEGRLSKQQQQRLQDWKNRSLKITLLGSAAQLTPVNSDEIVVCTIDEKENQ
jgi:DNA-binding transcriptional MerR regulator